MSDFDLEEFPQQTNFDLRKARFPGVENLYGSFRKNGECWIAFFQVAPDARARGEGTSALKALEKRAARFGCNRVTGDLLAGSEGFWQKAGYEIIPGKKPRVFKHL